ncbi:hypothetical protein C8F01DRAFT_48456 [Mycena amicta]|nr:hypothetical protein C8F01DRAFT_48456 [Mycena amicta]
MARLVSRLTLLIHPSLLSFGLLTDSLTHLLPQLTSPNRLLRRRPLPGASSSARARDYRYQRLPDLTEDPLQKLDAPQCIESLRPGTSSGGARLLTGSRRRILGTAEADTEDVLLQGRS